MKKYMLMMAVVLVGGCKDKGASDGAAPASGGPACADAAAAYIKADIAGGIGNLAKLNPTPEQVKVVTGQLEANCTAGWTAETKTCVLTATSLDRSKCWKDAMAHAMADQVVFDFVASTKK